MTIGKRIKELRESLGYSAPDFAKLLGIHKSSMYRYEESNINEKRDLPISVAILIAERFNISLDWLAGLSEEKYRSAKQTQDKLISTIESISTEGREEILTFATYIKAKEDQDGE